MILRGFFFFFTGLFGPGLAMAQSEAPVCVNGPYEANQELLKTFNSSTDPMKLAFVKFQAEASSHSVPTTQLQPQDCTPKNQVGFFQRFLREASAALRTPPISPAPTNTEEPAATATTQTPPPAEAYALDKSCIQDALRRDPNQDTYICASSNQRKPRPLDDDNQCYTQTLMDYIHFAVSQGLECMGAVTPSDLKFMYKKFNTESGFHFPVAYRGGVGIGGMTSIAVEDIAGKKLADGSYDDRTGHGMRILKDIAGSTKKSCEAFKGVAAEDLKTPPLISNYCAWTNVGNGLTRSILYSIAYHIYMRETQVIPMIAKIAPHLILHEDLLNILAVVIYGAGGKKQAKWIVRSNRVGPETNAQQLMEKVKMQSLYVQQNDKKMQEALCERHGLPIDPKGFCHTNFSREEIAGDKCVSKK